MNEADQLDDRNDKDFSLDGDEEVSALVTTILIL